MDSEDIAYKYKCTDCGNTMMYNSIRETAFCDNCKRKSEAEKIKEGYKYTVIIEVEGTIKNKRVRGITSRKVIAENESDAKTKAVNNFIEDPDYNTDISVNKQRFPDGEYLDNWSYSKHSATAVYVEPQSETGIVKWDTYQHKI